MGADFTRRDVLKMATGGAVSGLVGCAAPKAKPEGDPRPPARMPVVFVSHGSPMVAVRPDAYTRAVAWMGEDLPSPRAIVVVSAHWVEPAPTRVTAAERSETIHDFYGFPEELYALTYPSPGHPPLAKDIASALSAAGFPTELDGERGLDHGAWVPLRYAYPRADIPVLEVALTAEHEPRDLMKLGAALAPFRERGVLLVGSGGAVHNLRLSRAEERGARVDTWALAFDSWVREKLEHRELDSLLEYRKCAPHAEMAHPTTEHFDPLFVVAGASGPGDKVKDIFEGFHGPNLSMRTFMFAS
ncbi:MAG: dioxygenase [Planctomycetes bacterium]|nr:dioxygenase [Planctomycetota bacterium]